MLNRKLKAARTRVRSSWMLVLVALTVAGVSACDSSAKSPGADAPAASAGPGGSVPAAIEVYPQTYTSWLPVIAKGAGFFARNGINAKIVSVAGGGPVAMDALANGSADIAMADMSIAGPLLEKGVGLKVISGAALANWTLVAPSSAPAGSFPADVKAFNGKTTGVIVVGGSGYYFMKELAAETGINVTYSAFGAPVANAVSAMQAHRVYGEVVNPDVAAYLQRSHLGHVVFNFSDPAQLHAAGAPLSQLAGQPGDWMVATASWAAAHPAAVTKFQLAMDEAAVWAHNPANLGKVIALLKAAGQLPAYDSAVADKAVPPLLASLVSYLPSTTPSAYMRFWIKAGLLSKAIPTSQWVSSTIPASASAAAAAAKQAGSGS